jgi:hypothetical protein
LSKELGTPNHLVLSSPEALFGASRYPLNG